MLEVLVTVFVRHRSFRALHMGLSSDLVRDL